ncbi:WYL domain-containing protein [uncultured Prevotella sp.]|uniref:helix-turn-helix transcriptional regulator n=1 Tax=uncultured Prevotella sp. TaxID=159272 RepID=UPI0025FA728D|nr:WYL domain-containing protein [uncultured Prevotella sp.]
MTRYKILDDLLSCRYHNYSLDDLTEEVNKRLAELYPNTDGVGRRTIEKDIFYLEYEGPFFVEIERYTAPGYNTEKQKSYNKRCLRYINPSFSIFKKDLSDEEEYLLKESLSLLGQFEGLPNLDALEGLRLELGVRRNERKIISLTKNPLENSNLLGELFIAISHRQVIELHYHKFSSPHSESAVNIHPYLLKEYNRRWFLFAAAESDGKLLCFSLDRIDNVVPLPSHKYIDYDGEISEIFDDTIGVTINEESPVYNIVFWVSDISKDYVATKPIHDSQKNINGSEEAKLRNMYPTLSNGRFFSIDCKENYELIRELTGFGKELIVLSPVIIREKIEKRIMEMIDNYKSLEMRT